MQAHILDPDTQHKKLAQLTGPEFINTAQRVPGVDFLNILQPCNHNLACACSSQASQVSNSFLHAGWKLMEAVCMRTLQV